MLNWQKIGNICNVLSCQYGISSLRVRYLRYEVIQSRAIPQIPYEDNVDSKMLWSITSKAFERSKNIPMGTSFWYIDEATSLRKKMAVSVLIF